jgi:glycosyltransferase involved in cell wall biosynthesis
LPEVVRYPEMMFNPNDINEIADKCIAILKDSNARADNIELGSKNIIRFSWRESAKKMINIYNSI